MLQKAKVADGYAVSGAGCSARTFARPASHVNRKDHNLRKIGTTRDLVFTIGYPLRSQRGKLTSPSQRLERSTLLETLVLSSATTKTEAPAKNKVPLTSERGTLMNLGMLTGRSNEMLSESGRAQAESFGMSPPRGRSRSQNSVDKQRGQALAVKGPAIQASGQFDILRQFLYDNRSFEIAAGPAGVTQEPVGPCGCFQEVEDISFESMQLPTFSHHGEALACSRSPPSYKSLKLSSSAKAQTLSPVRSSPQGSDQSDGSQEYIDGNHHSESSFKCHHLSCNPSAQCNYTAMLQTHVFHGGINASGFQSSFEGFEGKCLTWARWISCLVMTAIAPCPFTASAAPALRIT